MGSCCQRYTCTWLFVLVPTFPRDYFLSSSLRAPLSNSGESWRDTKLTIPEEEKRRRRKTMLPNCTDRVVYKIKDRSAGHGEMSIIRFVSRRTRKKVLSFGPQSKWQHTRDLGVYFSIECFLALIVGGHVVYTSSYVTMVTSDTWYTCTYLISNVYCMLHRRNRFILLT